MKHSECLVVGAGVIGLSVALRLHSRGVRVRVLKAGRPDASLAAAGMLAPGIEAAEAVLTPGVHARLGELLLRAGRLWPAFAAELCADSSDLRAVGYRTLDTLVASEEGTPTGLHALAEAARRFGVAADLLAGHDARLLEPVLSQTVPSALHFPGDALVEPPLLIGRLTLALRTAGIAIEQARVVRVSQTGGGVRLDTADGAVLQAGAVVLAPGWPGAAQLAPELSYIVPIRGQIATLSARRPPRTMLRGPGVYLAPRADGRVDAGATSERGVTELRVDQSAIQALHARAAALAPDLADAWTITSRVGIRPGSPDQAPILGASALGDRVFLAAAPHRNGILLAPLLAAAVADGITGAPDSDGWLQAFAATRFQA